MPELEHRLRALGAGLDWPAEPQLAVAVRSRLDGQPAPARRRSRPLVLALAVLVVALGAALLVPQARTSILRFLHLGGVTVERVDRLPETSTRAPVWLGVPTSLAAANERFGRPLALPGGRRPDAVFVDGSIARGGIVTLRYGSAARPRLLVSTFRTGSLPVVEKYVQFSTGVQRLTVNGRPGLWVDREHVAELGALPPRLVAGTLLWLSGDLTIRLEADVSQQEALELARTFRR